MEAQPSHNLPKFLYIYKGFDTAQTRRLLFSSIHCSSLERRGTKMQKRAGDSGMWDQLSFFSPVILLNGNGITLSQLPGKDGKENHPFL